MASDHAEIPELVASQDDKVTTVNEAINLLDRMCNRGLDLDIDNANLTLTDTQPTDAQAKQNFFFTVTTTTTPLTADRTIFVPADRKVWVFSQEADVDEEFSVLVRVVGSGGAAVTLPNNGYAMVYCDGTDCIEVLRKDSEASSVFEATTGTINLDFDGDSIRTATLTGSTTIALTNPRQGKTIWLDVTGGGNALNLPGSVTVLDGDTFVTGSRNFITLTCIDDSTPEYIATIKQ